MLINFILFTILIAVIINSNKSNSVIIIAILVTFFISSIIILFFMNWLLNRIVFSHFYLINKSKGVEILNIISEKFNIEIKKLEGNIYYSSYKVKRMGNLYEKELLFIIEDKSFFFNAKYKSDLIFLYKEDVIEKYLKKILSENSTHNSIENSTNISN